MLTALTAMVIFAAIAALAFEFINGFHDTANAIATVVATGVLKMRTAIVMAAGLNFVGAFIGTAVAGTIGKEILHPEVIGSTLVLSALLGAIIWNLFTWWIGLPSSSSHALIGGMIGSGVALSGWGSIKFAGLQKIVISLVTSPIIGLVAGFLLIVFLTWATRKEGKAWHEHVFRWLQVGSSAVMAVAHGSNDAQKTMGILTVLLYSSNLSGDHKLVIPIWIVFTCALTMALGTACGGKRIIKTLGEGIIKLDPMDGFAAETTSAAIILTSSFHGLPVSTTHVIGGAVTGVGAGKNHKDVQWATAKKILSAWIFTIPACGILGFVLAKVISMLGS